MQQFDMSCFFKVKVFCCFFFLLDFVALNVFSRCFEKLIHKYVYVLYSFDVHTFQVHSVSFCLKDLKKGIKILFATVFLYIRCIDDY